MEQAQKTFPYAYITKPFDDMELKFAIELAFHKFELEKNLEFNKIYETIDNLMTGIFIANADGDILFENRFIKNIFSDESSRKKIETDRIMALQNEIKRKDLMDTLKKQGHIKNETLQIVQKDNTPIKVKMSVKLYNNKIYGIINPYSPD
ncbi:hypothetical protein [Methanobacterium petrolearium]|nr:hypothetical protein GCM10025861_04520 [Methanobacterium petrolearium]